ncbi:MAG: hypothetical protein H5T49_00495 [Hadesarchaea archaeon]|nr:hypothetical protein [Hadesarchaea archaeon]
MIDSDQYIYIDTFFIQAFLWGKNDEKQLANETIRKIKNTVVNPNIHVKIPMIVIGEVINNLMRRFEIKEILNGNTLCELCKLLNDLGADLVPPCKRSIETARVLLDKDNQLKPVDAVILSQAVCDPNSTYLITSDKILLESNRIKEYLESDEIKENRRQKLKIAEKF